MLKRFIKSPVLSSVISIFIVIIGVMALQSLPIEQYPDIAPPTVFVSANYYGASPQTVQKSVIAPIEEAINGVEDMMYMTSSASSGMAEITVFFKQGIDADKAAVNIQNRLSTAMAQLPAEVKQVGVQVMKRQNSMLQIFAISSPNDTYDFEFLSNYLNINIKPKIMRIPGIGNFQAFSSDYSMRVWLDPAKMASLGISSDEVLEAISEQNMEAATGVLGENSSEETQYSMVFRGRKISEEEFRNIIIRTNENGEILRLGDVAEVGLGSEHYLYTSSVNGHPGTLCILYQTANSNATMINEEVARILEEISHDASFPPDVKIDVLMNTNEFLYSSIHEVVKTLIEAIILVIIIVLLFLHDIPSTIIPFIGIMVSLIGTFAFMMLAGFSINLISLFALVLVIGTVVDDSIIVVEAVHEKLDSGYTSSLKASVDAMSGITSAVITSSLVFMAVFLPVSMMGGTSGVFFRQFGLTMAVAVGISAINALTLSPALCAIMIKPKPKTDEGLKGFKKMKFRFSNGFNAAFERMSEKYKNGIRPFIKRPWSGFLFVIAGVLVMMWSINNTPSGFVPQEDQGLVLCDVIMPTGTSKAVTSEMTQKVMAEVSQIEEVESAAEVGGFGFSCGAKSSAGSLIIRLKPWDQREPFSIANVIMGVYALNEKYPGAQILPFVLPMIPGYGNSADIEINMQDRSGGDMQEFLNQVENFVAEMNQNPKVQNCYHTFSLDNPQWLVDIDIAKCRKVGITANEVLGTLATYTGGSYAGDINLYGKIYKVMVQGTPESHRDETALSNTYVKLPNGDMSPLSNFLTLTRIYGSDNLQRFNMLNTIKVLAAPGSGASTGDIITAAKDATKILPPNYTLEFGGMAREQDNGGSMLFIFGLSALFIYLILSALYESYLLPLSIILTVPMGIMGSFLATKLLGLDNNIYLQTGVVMLIGLLSKTGILITEFALQKRHAGLSIEDSALEAAKARLRPILMTAGTMVVGLLPLIVSTGAGAVGNISLGIGAVAGMLVGCIALLFLVPALYVVFERLQEKIKPLKDDDNE